VAIFRLCRSAVMRTESIGTALAGFVGMPIKSFTSALALILGLGGCVALSDRDQEVGGSGSASSSAMQVRGAVFTTTADGSRVNANIYAAKTDVYLDGGPGPSAPPHAAALAEGDYYFQVTNPNGNDLLSTDDIACRRFHVNASGVIDSVDPGPGCAHEHGIDQDYASLGAITVQLMPYLDTTNPGGEYKVWVTPVAAYDATSTHAHGFVPSASKTDNFKVLMATPPPPPPCCGNGVLETGEACDDGNTTDGDGCSAACAIEPPPPSPCCGNGVLEAGEACDDGNTVDGDGCSATCTLEVGPCGDVADPEIASAVMSPS
jgi:cysteine-rich repeat protein